VLNLVMMAGERQESLSRRGNDRERDARRVDPRVSKGQQGHDAAAPLRFGVRLLRSTD